MVGRMSALVEELGPVGIDIAGVVALVVAGADKAHYPETASVDTRAVAYDKLFGARLDSTTRQWGGGWAAIQKAPQIFDEMFDTGRNAVLMIPALLRRCDS